MNFLQSILRCVVKKSVKLLRLICCSWAKIIAFATSETGIVFFIMLTPSVIVMLIIAHATSMKYEGDRDFIIGEELKLPRTLKYTDEIPHRIHQMYADENVPKIYSPYIKTWVKNHPSWEYWFWTDQDIRNLLMDRFPKFQTLFDRYRHNLQRADMGRYLILHTYGGLYADADFKSLKPLDQYFKNRSCVLSPEPEVQSYLLYRKTTIMTNSIMACAPAHPFLTKLIESLPHTYKYRRKKDGIVQLTGPIFLQSVVEQYEEAERPKCNASYCEIFYAPYQHFLPTTDHIQSVNFETTCKKMKKRKWKDPVLIENCAKLERNNWILNDTSEAYANHDWLHAGYTFFKKLREVTEPLNDILHGITIHRYRKGAFNSSNL